MHNKWFFRSSKLFWIFSSSQIHLDPKKA